MKTCSAPHDPWCDECRAELVRLRESLEAILNYVPEGFISPMDDEDTLNIRDIARNALRETND